MIHAAIRTLAEKGGSTAVAIDRYIRSEYHDLPWGHQNLFPHYLRKLLVTGEIKQNKVGRYLLADSGGAGSASASSFREPKPKASSSRRDPQKIPLSTVPHVTAKGAALVRQSEVRPLLSSDMRVSDDAFAPTYVHTPIRVEGSVINVDATSGELNVDASGGEYHYGPVVPDAPVAKEVSQDDGIDNTCSFTEPLKLDDSYEAPIITVPLRAESSSAHPIMEDRPSAVPPDKNAVIYSEPVEKTDLDRPLLMHKETRARPSKKRNSVPVTMYVEREVVIALPSPAVNMFSKKWPSYVPAASYISPQKPHNASMPPNKPVARRIPSPTVPSSSDSLDSLHVSCRNKKGECLETFKHSVVVADDLPPTSASDGTISLQNSQPDSNLTNVLAFNCYVESGKAKISSQAAVSSHKPPSLNTELENLAEWRPPPNSDTDGVTLATKRRNEKRQTDPDRIILMHSSSDLQVAMESLSLGPLTGQLALPSSSRDKITKSAADPNATAGLILQSEAHQHGTDVRVNAKGAESHERLLATPTESIVDSHSEGTEPEQQPSSMAASVCMEEEPLSRSKCWDASLPESSRSPAQKQNIPSRVEGDDSEQYGGVESQLLPPILVPPVLADQSSLASSTEICVAIDKRTVELGLPSFLKVDLLVTEQNSNTESSELGPPSSLKLGLLETEQISNTESSELGPSSFLKLDPLVIEQTSNTVSSELGSSSSLKLDLLVNEYIALPKRHGRTPMKKQKRTQVAETASGGISRSVVGMKSTPLDPRMKEAHESDDASILSGSSELLPLNHHGRPPKNSSRGVPKTAKIFVRLQSLDNIRSRAHCQLPVFRAECGTSSNESDFKSSLQNHHDKDPNEFSSLPSEAAVANSQSLVPVLESVPLSTDDISPANGFGLPIPNDHHRSSCKSSGISPCTQTTPDAPSVRQSLSSVRSRASGKSPAFSFETDTPLDNAEVCPPLKGHHDKEQGKLSFSLSEIPATPGTENDRYLSPSSRTGARPPKRNLEVRDGDGTGISSEKRPPKQKNEVVDAANDDSSLEKCHSRPPKQKPKVVGAADGESSLEKHRSRPPTRKPEVLDTANDDSSLKKSRGRPPKEKHKMVDASDEPSVTKRHDKSPKGKHEVVNAANGDSSPKIPRARPTKEKLELVDTANDESSATKHHRKSPKENHVVMDAANDNSSLEKSHGRPPKEKHQLVDTANGEPSTTKGCGKPPKEKSEVVDAADGNSSLKKKRKVVDAATGDLSLKKCRSRLLKENPEVVDTAEPSATTRHGRALKENPEVVDAAIVQPSSTTSHDGHLKEKLEVLFVAKSHPSLRKQRGIPPEGKSEVPDEGNCVLPLSKHHARTLEDRIKVQDQATKKHLKLKRHGRCIK